MVAKRSSESTSVVPAACRVTESRRWFPEREAGFGPTPHNCFGTCAGCLELARGGTAVRKDAGVPTVTALLRKRLGGKAVASGAVLAPRVAPVGFGWLGAKGRLRNRTLGESPKSEEPMGVSGQRWWKHRWLATDSAMVKPLGSRPPRTYLRDDSFSDGSSSDEDVEAKRREGNGSW
jgi:hypothetical protein